MVQPFILPAIPAGQFDQPKQRLPTPLSLYHNADKISDTIFDDFSLDPLYNDSVSYNALLQVQAGDTIDFAVKAIQQYGDGCSTVVAATIDFVPEPSTFILFMFAAIGVFAYVWRQH